MHLSKEAIGNRLQIQRKQLGFIQERFAAELAISKRTLAGYEAGTSDIGASVLAKASELGVDVQFVVTGKHALAGADAISAPESDLLEHFRKLPEGEQGYTRTMIAALAEKAGR